MNTAIALLPLVATTLGVVSSIGGFLLYYNGSVRKRYAAERDFQHLLRNQENISQHLIQLDDSLNDIRTELARLTQTVISVTKKPSIAVRSGASYFDDDVTSKNLR